MKYEVTQVGYNTYIIEAIRSCGHGPAMELQVVEATIWRELVEKPHGERYVWFGELEDGTRYSNDSDVGIVRVIKAELESQLTGKEWTECLNY